MRERDFKTVTVAATLSILFCAACLTGCKFSPGAEEEQSWRCNPLPSSFQEEDLIGTWQSTYYPGIITDTLLLREDGTYQQIYENQDTGEHYVSSWSQWRIEQSSAGTTRLYLEGMRYCLATNEICNQSGGGGGSHSYYDPCEDVVIWDMGSEVILGVHGVEGFQYPGIDSVPRDILLWHMKFNPEGTDEFFILLE